MVNAPRTAPGTLRRVAPWFLYLLVVLLTCVGVYFAWVSRGNPDLPDSFGAR